MRDHYDCHAPLRSPPHLTVHMPFLWSEKKEEKLIRNLRDFASGQEMFSVTLDGFGAFAPRVIFVQVEENQELLHFREALLLVTRRNLNLLDDNYKNRGFHPHMTIAFRDLRKAQFTTAWEQFQSQTFQTTFQVEKLSLLKHNGKVWDIYEDFFLKGSGMNGQGEAEGSSFAQV